MTIGKSVIPICCLAVTMILASSGLYGADGAAGIKRHKTGHPDFSGLWFIQGFNGGGGGRAEPDPELRSKLGKDTVVLSFREPFGGLQLKPEALKQAEAYDPEWQEMPENVCKRPSALEAMPAPFPVEINQGTDLIVMRLEYYDIVRTVFMDGRGHPTKAEYPAAPAGHSTGYWDGDILVVDTVHMVTAKSNSGYYHTDDVHLIERFKLSPDGNTLFYSQEYEDPPALYAPAARFVAYEREYGYTYPYECDPNFGIDFQHRKEVHRNRAQDSAN